MKRLDGLLGMHRGQTRREALLMKKGPSRRVALLEQTRLQPTRFQNRAGRHFFVTLKGSYVVLEYGRRVYGRKARFMDGRRIANASRVPLRIRPKRV
jgi:hypothetical protein